MDPERQPKPGQSELSEAEVRRVARLARINLTDAEVVAMRAQLAAVLEHVRVLQELDLTHTAPMAHPSDTTNQWGSDNVCPSLPPQIAMGLAASSAESFVVVPKVFGNDVGGA